jgi:hypothetical protein
MESHRDDKEPSQPQDEDELEQREYSSPACYLHEFEQQANAADEARTAPKPVPDSKAAKPADVPPETR